MNTHKVLTYAARSWISPEMLADQREIVEKMLQADIVAKAEREGLVVLPDTAQVKFHERNYGWDEGWDELPESMSDYLLALSSVRCYRPEPTGGEE